MKVIVILGPTAVGKSDLALRLAKQTNGEIISADATQIYRDLNIGAAKITPEEMDGIPHHLIDIKNFDESFNAFMFVESAKRIIDDIIAREKQPIIVGGTNLYVSALVNGFNFEKAGKNDEVYKNKFNLEFILFALNLENRQKLYDRINLRVDKMIENGLVQEVKNLKAKGLSLDSQAGKGIGYRDLLLWLEGQQSFEEAVNKIKQHSRNFAKRQLTWLRSMKNLIWLDAEKDNVETILTELNKRN